MKDICTHEADVNEMIVKKCRDEIAKLNVMNRHLKNVMRVPKLYEIFQAEIKELEVEERKQMMQVDTKINNKKTLTKKTAELSNDEKESLLFSLSLQFQSEFEI